MKNEWKAIKVETERQVKMLLQATLTKKKRRLKFLKSEIKEEPLLQI